MSFEKLGLLPSLLKAVKDQGYTSPSPIQAATIPHILEGSDMLASAQTGTGKTAGFTLPMLQLLNERKQPGRRVLKALVLTPTRELAAQVHESVVNYSQHMDIKSTVVFGGVKINPQISAMRAGVDVLVATPGRLLDLVGQKVVHLGKVEIMVLDEADRMLDMGFLRDIQRIMKLMPAKKQSLLFSATFSKEIKKLASGILHNPKVVEATPDNTTAEKVDQTFYRTDKSKKANALIHLFQQNSDWTQVLVFTRTKHGANRLAQKLVKKDISAAAIHGDKSQNARTRALKEFKEGKVAVLVATDIAARGLDIPLLPYVINYELPNVAEDYVHRIGRTGRAGASGQAISLVSIDELEYVKNIEKLLGESLSTSVIEGFEPTESSLGEAVVAPKKAFYRKTNNSHNKGNSHKSQNSRGKRPRQSGKKV